MSEEVNKQGSDAAKGAEDAAKTTGEAEKITKTAVDFVDHVKGEAKLEFNDKFTEEGWNAFKEKLADVKDLEFAGEEELKAAAEKYKAHLTQVTKNSERLTMAGDLYKQAGEIPKEGRGVLERLFKNVPGQKAFIKGAEDVSKFGFANVNKVNAIAATGLGIAALAYLTSGGDKGQTAEAGRSSY